MKFELDDDDLDLIFDAICFYDIENCETMNDRQNHAFHYLYDISKPSAREEKTV
tara:strand:+ start:373 stop:534 length:162 start_codon:yes stop_codon:yes gene_type:complete